MNSFYPVSIRYCGIILEALDLICLSLQSNQRVKIPDVTSNLEQFRSHKSKEGDSVLSPHIVEQDL